MARLRLLQIPFSHNCVKVRVALRMKGLAYEVEDIPPTDRTAVVRASGQGLVPVLVDGPRCVVGSTAILLYLEEKFPEPPLLPKDPKLRADCLILADWADRAFMAASRRIVYFNVLSETGTLGGMFFPRSSGWKRRIQELIAKRIVSRRFRITREGYPRDVADVRAAAALAARRLAVGPYLQGDEITLADIALATLSAPLAADPDVVQDEAVRALIEWGRPIIGPDAARLDRDDPGARRSARSPAPR